MELKEFISDVLVAIMEGINSVEQKATGQGAIINPREYRQRPGNYEIDERVPMDAYNKVQNIEFDVALTVENVGTKGGGGKIAVMGVP
jgi:hypothetical protein